MVADEVAALGRIGVNAKTHTTLHRGITLYDDLNKKFLLDSAGMGIKETRRNFKPVAAAVTHKNKGATFIHYNSKLGELPPNLHPLLEPRIREAQLIPYGNTHGAGSHAEIYALNEALHAHPGSTLDDFIVRAINSGYGNVRTWGNSVPRCPHCEVITNGVEFRPSGLKY